MGGALCVVALGSLVAFSNLRAATPQTVEEIAQSLACIPPGTIGCTDQFSRIRFIESLRSAGILNSDVGAIELASCEQSMNIYENNLARYNTCPSDQKVPADQEDAARNYLLPLLCGPVLGGHGVYNKDIKTCECEPGYFLYDNACVTSTEICRQKYGSTAQANDGNCITPTVSTPRPTTTPKPTLKPSSTPTPTQPSTPHATPTKEPTQSLVFVGPTPSPILLPTVVPKPRNVILRFIINVFHKLF